MTDEAQAVLSPAEAPEVEPDPEVGQEVEGRENGSYVLVDPVERLARYLEHHGVFARGITRYELAADLLEQAQAELATSLPVGTLREALPYLRRPFAPNAVRFKIQAEFGKPPKGGLIVAYVDARTVVERLNYVCGPLWDDTYDMVSNGILRCRLTVDGVARTDVGEGGLTKAGHSDALKRAAVKFGVGVSLYAIPQVRLWAGKGKTKLELRGEGEKAHLFLTDDNVAALRKGYAKWLEAEGAKHFGEPLDHGDAADAIGDPLDPERPEDHPVPEGVDPETGEVKPIGRKISFKRVAEISKLIEDAPPWMGVAHQHAELDTIGVPEDDNLVRRIKQLRENQAERFERWLKGLPAEEPQAPEVE